MRFTGRDPREGTPEEPITLHRYLYCGNEPINRIDPEGEYFGSLVGLTVGVMIGQMFDNKEYAIKAKIYSTVVGTLSGMCFDVYGGRQFIKSFENSKPKKQWDKTYGPVDNDDVVAPIDSWKLVGE